MAVDAPSRPRLALGPVQYFWTREKLLEFYAEMADAPADIIYLGETVCAKRRSLAPADWQALGRELQAAGKQVVLSTLALIEAGSEIGALRRLCEGGDFLIEANDMAAVHLLAGRRPFVTGPSVNLYNEHSLRLLADLGLARWTAPVEMTRDALSALQAVRPAGLETEIMAFGRLPLAYAARCFTARAHNLPKDDCRFVCKEYPDGLLLSTREAQPLLAFNGIQTQSALTLNLLGEMDDIRTLGVDVLRISPQPDNTAEIVAAFGDCLVGRSGAAEAAASLQVFMPTGPCSGYWHGGAGMSRAEQALPA